MARGADGSVDDYIVTFSLKLFEACAQKERLPLIVPRIIVNNLFMQIVIFSQLTLRTMMS